MKLSSSLGTVVVDDDHGARLTSLKVAGREWLTPSNSAHDATGVFVREGLGGWDEACPTVAPCSVAGINFGDHGLLWNRPWQVTEESPERAVWHVEVPEIPFSLTRTIDLTDRALALNYQLRVESEFAMPILWSAHPLFVAGPSSRFVFAREPAAVEEWPMLGRRLADPGSPLAALAPGNARKGFVPTADDVALEHVDGARMTMAFTGAISAVGLWWDRGLFGAQDSMAIEPTLARTDRADSVVVGRVSRGAVLRWGMRLTFMPGR